MSFAAGISGLMSSKPRNSAAAFVEGHRHPGYGTVEQFHFNKRRYESIVEGESLRVPCCDW